MVVCLDNNIYVRCINEISKLRCRTIIISCRWFGVSLLSFFCTMKTLIIGYGLNNVTISNQPCNKLQNLCSLDETATSTTIVSFFWF